MPLRKYTSLTRWFTRLLDAIWPEKDNLRCVAEAVFPDVAEDVIPRAAAISRSWLSFVAINSACPKKPRLPA